MDDKFISTAQGFYRALKANNTKPWWHENRATYDEVLKPGALQLLDDINPHLSKIMDAPVTSKLFRPYRDVRFAKDKSPHQTHLHMMWRAQNDGAQDPVFYYAIDTDKVTIGAGMMDFNKTMMAEWRRSVDLEGDRIA